MLQTEQNLASLYSYFTEDQFQFTVLPAIFHHTSVPAQNMYYIPHFISLFTMLRGVDTYM